MSFFCPSLWFIQIEHFLVALQWLKTIGCLFVLHAILGVVDGFPIGPWSSDMMKLWVFICSFSPNVPEKWQIGPVDLFVLYGHCRISLCCYISIIYCFNQLMFQSYFYILSF